MMGEVIPLAILLSLVGGSVAVALLQTRASGDEPFEHDDGTMPDEPPETRLRRGGE